MLKSIAKLLKNPRLQQLLVWAAPIILGWLFDKYKQKQPSTKGRKKTK